MNQALDQLFSVIRGTASTFGLTGGIHYPLEDPLCRVRGGMGLAGKDNLYGSPAIIRSLVNRGTS